MWLSLGFLAGLLLLLGDHRLEHEPVVLLVQALRDLLAHALKLRLAAQLDLAQERRELVGDDPARGLLLGLRQPGKLTGRELRSSVGGAATQSRYGAGPAASTEPCSSM